MGGDELRPDGGEVTRIKYQVVDPGKGAVGLPLRPAGHERRAWNLMRTMRHSVIRLIKTQKGLPDGLRRF
jgi:hypothetical protein